MAAVATSTTNTTIREPRINPLFSSSKSSYSSSPTCVSFLQARSGMGSHLLATVARREVSTTAMAIEEIGNGAVGLTAQRPDSFGRFERFGGKYVPETLMHAHCDSDRALAPLSYPSATRTFACSLCKAVIRLAIASYALTRTASASARLQHDSGVQWPFSLSTSPTTALTTACSLDLSPASCTRRTLGTVGEPCCYPLQDALSVYDKLLPMLDSQSATTSAGWKMSTTPETKLLVGTPAPAEFYGANRFDPVWHDSNFICMIQSARQAPLQQHLPTMIGCHQLRANVSVAEYANPRSRLSSTESPSRSSASLARSLGLPCLKVGQNLDSLGTDDHEKILSFEGRVLDVLDDNGAVFVSIAMALHLIQLANSRSEETLLNLKRYLQFKEFNFEPNSEGMCNYDFWKEAEEIFSKTDVICGTLLLRKF
ncbi:Tryptophan synthase beta chain 2, chloroplastic [Dendrobium catenatum]|uniref:Tryptophan synthase beta chain 2, chloroplastic n=1 Tax=Dendrobium catenatum TaxID=906689 RepID=A0A2I0VHG0_9ASPA|nr:Tryptophan synthase beta chain 2, chloroplastic [Dendrobium catenatum]